MTRINAKGFDWCVAIAYRDLRRHGSNKSKTWVLSLRIQVHGHEVSSNPLDYEIHQQRQPDYAKAILLARTHRVSGSIYKQSMRILENTPKEPNEVFHLKQKKFYIYLLDSSPISIRPPSRPSPPPPTTQPVPQPQKPRGRPKGIKNSAPTSSAAPPSFSASPVLTKFKSGRQIKEKKAWEQEKDLSQKRFRRPTLNATLRPAMQPIKKKSKQNLVPTECMDERESRQLRILGAGYLLGEPPGSEK